MQKLFMELEAIVLRLRTQQSSQGRLGGRELV